MSMNFPDSQIKYHSNFQLNKKIVWIERMWKKKLVFNLFGHLRGKEP